MHFIPQKETKGQDIATFFVEHPISKNFKIYIDVPDKVTKVNTVLEG